MLQEGLALPPMADLMAAEGSGCCCIHIEPAAASVSPVAGHPRDVLCSAVGCSLYACSPGGSGAGNAVASLSDSATWSCVLVTGWLHRIVAAICRGQCLWVFAGAAKRLTRWLCKRHQLLGFWSMLLFGSAVEVSLLGRAGSGGAPGLQAYSRGCQAHSYFRFKMFCHSYGLADAGTVAQLSTRQWLQQRLQNLKLADCVDTQEEGNKYSVGPKTVATWDVRGSIREHLQDADDEHLLHAPLNQYWQFHAGTHEGAVTSFILHITRCLGSPMQLPDVCQV